MLTYLFRRCTCLGRALVRALRQHLLTVTTPAEQGVAIGALADLVRGRPTLIAESAFLHQQLLVLRRGVKCPRCTPTDRALLVLLASRLRTWRQALVIVQPETLLRWHRQGFRLFWRRKSRPRSSPKSKVPVGTIALIRAMAVADRLWGAERIRGELLKLDIRVATTTVQRHMRAARPPRRDGQAWATFLRNHAGETWACDFLPVTDALFQPLHALVVVALATRRVVHAGVTRHPTAAWAAQQLRFSCPGAGPVSRPAAESRPNYGKFGICKEYDTQYAPSIENNTEEYIDQVSVYCIDF